MATVITHRTDVYICFYPNRTVSWEGFIERCAQRGSQVLKGFVMKSPTVEEQQYGRHWIVMSAGACQERRKRRKSGNNHSGKLARSVVLKQASVSHRAITDN